VGIVFDSGGIDDKSFNASAWAGMQRAEKELGISVKKIESRSENDYDDNLTAMLDQSCDLIVGIGINMQQAMDKVAKENPDTKFAIVDAPVEQPNVRSLVFKEEEGSFLVGYIAGAFSKTKKVGFIGGQQIPLIVKFYSGYAAGAKAANPDVEVLPEKYTGDWNNVDVAKTAATQLFADGADVIYAAAGKAGLGVITAAKEKKLYAIGVDSDQDYIAEGTVLTSMVKKVDEGIFQTIKDLKEGAWSTGIKVYDLKAGGVGTSEFKFTKALIGDATIAKVDEYKGKITSGEIKVPSTKDELSAYLAGLKK